MTRRKLSKRQKWQAQQAQADRIKDALKLERDLSLQTQSGDLSSPQQA